MKDKTAKPNLTMEYEIKDIYKIIDDLIDTSIYQRIFFLGEISGGITSTDFWCIEEDDKISDFVTYEEGNEGTDDKLTADILEMNQFLTQKNMKNFNQIFIEYTFQKEEIVANVALDYFDWPEEGFAMYGVPDYYLSKALGEKYVTNFGMENVEKMTKYAESHEAETAFNYQFKNERKDEYEI
ncbi:hypothetical protein D3P96_00445 [Weissella viridescens]|uniref:DUF600 family protein n=1 Tax=Weissella viridescens TaxID=1629 RepID=A0A3P2RLF0_WEIVI|nr:hypothetical protein [Weissella viridescens]RRG18492.1 hypothetical protein D3P96_00445 [Weissella viridescens]